MDVLVNDVIGSAAPDNNYMEMILREEKKRRVYVGGEGIERQGPRCLMIIYLEVNETRDDG